jgi:2-dehydropantoate 2-reductase
MENKDLSLLVVGAGAIGGITAALLKREGYNVEIVCKYDDYASLIRMNGIEVNGVCGHYKVQLTAYASVDEVREKKDVILHATKANDMIEAAKSIQTILKDDGFVVSMQNGICEDDLAGVLGKEKIIGCVTGWGATMESPGELKMTSAGEFVLGYPGRKPDEFLTTLANIMSSVMPVRITDNIMGHLYSKLIINSCITSLGAICGLYLGKMLSIKKIRSIFIEIIREAMAVAEKMQIKIEVFGDKLDFRKFIEGNNALADVRRHLTIRIIGLKYRRLKSSSLQSLERGKLTEVEYFNGYIAKNGRMLGIPVPVNEAIARIVHEIEKGEKNISLSNFESPAFERFNR